MASTSTGEMFTQEQVDAMSLMEREELGLIRLKPHESTLLAPMTNEQRKTYLQNKSKSSRRMINKRERQNKRKARNAAR